METVLDESLETPQSQPILFATFWQRVGAWMLDNLILSPISLGLTFYALIYVKSFALSLLPSLIHLLYKVWMEKTYGATLGKQIVGIRVTDESLQGISYSQSFTRNYFYLFILILAFFQQYDLFSINAMQSADTIVKIVEIQQLQDPLLSRVSILFNILFMVDCLLMQGDASKRTLHDRWAKTIVLKK